MAVPAEGEDIVTRLKILGNLHQVLECPGVSLVRVGVDVNLGPLRVLGGGALGGGDQVVGDPALLVEIVNVIWLPVDPLGVSVELGVSPLEALLGHVPVLPVVHLAQSVGVAATVLSPGVPVNLGGLSPGPGGGGRAAEQATVIVIQSRLAA